MKYILIITIPLSSDKANAKYWPLFNVFIFITKSVESELSVHVTVIPNVSVYELAAKVFAVVVTVVIVGIVWVVWVVWFIADESTKL